MSLRSASVFAIDLNCPASSYMLAVELCRRSVEDTMLFAPRDEMALVFAGTSDTSNPLNHNNNNTKGQQYAHISVPCALAAPTVDFLELLSCVAQPPLEERYEVDFLETLVVCDHLILERTANRRYKRVVYLLTDARVEVVRKGEIKALLESFRHYDVSLVVIGIDFSDPVDEEDFIEATDADDNNNNLVNLSVKAQNERVLHILCSSLGGDSMVVSLEEALETAGGLRRRTIIQRPILRVTLSIGDVRVATQMFTKTQEERLPALKKMTKTGEEVYMRTVYTTIGDSKAMLQTGEFVKGYQYGCTFIPCTQRIIEAMKVKGPRALDAVAFVPLQQVPVYVMLSGVKVIVPLADDMTGAKAFRSVVRAMAAANQAMIVRFVRTPDADPVLGICVPSSSEKRDVLFFSLLPFAEDVRSFQFSEYKEMLFGSEDDKEEEEERLLESIVEEMTVGEDVLRPQDTFNPVIQQYYATLRAKLRRLCDEKKGEEKEYHEEGSKPLQNFIGMRTKTDEEVLLPLLKEIQTTSAAFGSPGNQLEPILSGVRAKLEACSRLFVFVANRGERTVSEQQLCHSYSPASCRNSDADVSTRAPSTVAAPCVAFGATHITSIDQLDLFQAIVQSRDAAVVRRAMDELMDVLFGLLRYGLKEMQYAKCAEAILLIRQQCVLESVPAYFNGFLLKLMLMARGLGHEAFWQNNVVGRGIVLITKRECPNSTIDDNSDDNEAGPPVYRAELQHSVFRS